MFYHNPAFNAPRFWPLSCYTYNPAEPRIFALSTSLQSSPISQRLNKFFNNIEMSLIVHYLLLCFSLHACSARPLQVQGIGGSVQFSSGKETRPAITDEYSRIKGNFILTIGQGTTTTLASYCCGGNTMKQKTSEELDGRNERNKVAGKNVALPSATKVMHDMIKIEEEGRQVRILESRVASEDNAEESIGAEENDETGEDIAVMDYAQPHRKPPIHNNRKP